MADATTTLEALKVAEPPMLGADGKTTLAHMRWKVQVVNRLMIDAALGIADLPKGYNAAQARELIDTEARLCGYDPKHLMDVRTDAQVFSDAVESLLNAPAELTAQGDEILEQIEKQMDVADGYLVAECGFASTQVRERRLSKADEDRRNASKKSWGERIRRLRSIRSRARDAFPKGSCPPNAQALAAAHVLRFMVYVGRDAGGSVFTVGLHHGVAALALYEAENGKRWEKTQWIDVDFEGVLFVFPPGHGKTTFAAHRYGLRFAQNPRRRVLHAHAQSGEAEKNLAYVAAMFDPETAQGRRLRSLFPNVPPIRKKTHDTFDLAAVGDEKKRQPSMMAYGIMAKTSGSDADDLWFDDPCDQELAEQETTRVRVFDRMNGTWRTRKREKKGQRTFEFTTTTLWHHDDPNARRIQLARDKKIRLRVKILACGGPDDGFKPVWPEVYPSSKLKVIYAGMRNPRLYAAAYQSNPQPDSLRRIKSLAYYDPASDEHKDFMESATMYLSVDPSATNSSDSDEASFVYAGLGDVTTGDETVTHTRRLRIVAVDEFKASQGEAIDKAVGFARGHRVDEILWEKRGTTSAGPEMLEREYGLTVSIADPGNRDKLLRLEDVAPVMDASLQKRGLPPASVEFPGVVREDGTIGPDPEYAWYFQQILDAGVAVKDHALDATTQLVKRLLPDLRIGCGVVTETIRVMDKKRDPRVQEFLRRAFDTNSEDEPVAERDYVYCMTNMGNRVSAN